MAVHHKMIHNFNTFLIKIPADFFVKIDKLILKSWGSARNARKPKCHEKEQSRRTHTLPHFKTSNRAVVIRTGYLHKHGHGLMGWDWESRGKTMRLCQLISFQWARVVSLTNGAGKIGYPHAEEQRLTLESHHLLKLTQNRPKTFTELKP